MDPNAPALPAVKPPPRPLDLFSAPARPKRIGLAAPPPPPPPPPSIPLFQPPPPPPPPPPPSFQSGIPQTPIAPPRQVKPRAKSKPSPPPATQPPQQQPQQQQLEPVPARRASVGYGTFALAPLTDVEFDHSTMTIRPRGSDQKPSKPEPPPPPPPPKASSHTVPRAAFPIRKPTAPSPISSAPFDPAMEQQAKLMSQNIGWEAIAVPPIASWRPPPLSGHACCLVGTDWVVMFGGMMANNDFTYDLFAWHLPTSTWVPVQMTGDVPPPMSYATMAQTRPYELPNTIVMMYGGWGGGYECNPHMYVLEGFELYAPTDLCRDPTLQLHWSAPVVVGALPAARSHHSMTLVTGGMGNGRGELSEPHYIPDLSRGGGAVFELPRQQLVVFGGWNPLAPTVEPLVRMSSSASVVSTSSSSDGPAGHFLNDVHVLDVDTLEWHAIVLTHPLKPSPRASHAAFVYERSLFIWGGAGESGALNDCWALDLDKLQWRAIPQSGRLPSPRSGHAVLLSDQRLFLFGGQESDVGSNFLYVCQLGGMLSWTRIDPFLVDPPRPRMGFASCAIGRDTLLIHGGLSMQQDNNDNDGVLVLDDLFYLRTVSSQAELLVMCDGQRTSRTYAVTINLAYRTGDKTTDGKLRSVSEFTHQWYRRRALAEDGDSWFPIPGATHWEYVATVDDIGHVIGMSAHEWLDGFSTGYHHFTACDKGIMLDGDIEHLAKEAILDRRYELPITVAGLGGSAEPALLVMSPDYVRVKGSASCDFFARFSPLFRITLSTTSQLAFTMHVGPPTGEVLLAVATQSERDLVIVVARALCALAIRTAPLVMPHEDEEQEAGSSSSTMLINPLALLHETLHSGKEKAMSAIHARLVGMSDWVTRLATDFNAMPDEPELVPVERDVVRVVVARRVGALEANEDDMDSTSLHIKSSVRQQRPFLETMKPEELEGRRGGEDKVPKRPLPLHLAIAAAASRAQPSASDAVVEDERCSDHEGEFVSEGEDEEEGNNGQEEEQVNVPAASSDVHQTVRAQASALKTLLAKSNVQ